MAGRRGARGSAARLRHPRGDHFEHTFVAGPDGLEYLVFGTRHPTESAGCRARGRSASAGRGSRVATTIRGTSRRRASRSATATRRRAPHNIHNVEEIEYGGATARRTASLAPEGTTKLAGLPWEKLEPGHRGNYPHCHSAEEEIYVILDGSATLELWREHLTVEETPLRPAISSRARPARGISHSFRAGPEGVTMLTYGTRDPSDMAWFPRSRKIVPARRSASSGAIEELGYHDGEPVEDD